MALIGSIALIVAFAAAIFTMLTGAAGGMRFLGQAKVVGPAGNVLARTWAKAGLAVAELDVAQEIAHARRVLRHLDELRPATYRTALPPS